MQWGGVKEGGRPSGVRPEGHSALCGMTSPSALPLLLPPLPHGGACVRTTCLHFVSLASSSLQPSAPGWDSHPLFPLPLLPDVSSMAASRLPLPEGALTPLPEQLRTEFWG